jgi:glycosyltransferase involved in cell wall biosynthesis
VSGPLRIAVVARHAHRGESLPGLALEVVRGLHGRGHAVELFTIARTAERDLLPVPVHGVPARGGAGRLGLAREMRSFARAAARAVEGERARFDVVYTWMPGTWTSDVLSGPGLVDDEIRLYRAGRSETGLLRRAKDLAQPLARPAIGVRKRLERRALAWPGLRIVQVYTERIAGELERAHGIGRERVLVLPPGVSLERFAPGDRASARAELGLPDGFCVLFCGHGFERKGLDVALAALARMDAPATLVVVGRGDAQPGADAVFAGAVADPAPYYRAADALVFPSRADVWGAPVVEGMAAGLPVVASAAAGASEVVVDGETGFVLPAPPEPARLAATLDRLAANPELRARIGAAAAALSSERHLDRLEEALRDAAAARSAARARTTP